MEAQEDQNIYMLINKINDMFGWVRVGYVKDCSRIESCIDELSYVNPNPISSSNSNLNPNPNPNPNYYQPEMISNAWRIPLAFQCSRHAPHSWSLLFSHFHLCACNYIFFFVYNVSSHSYFFIDTTIYLHK